MSRSIVVLVAALLLPVTAGAQDVQPGPLRAAIEREAARLASAAPPGVEQPAPSPQPRVVFSPPRPSEQNQALAAFSSVVLSSLAGWPPSGATARDRARVNREHATVEGYFSERVLRLFRH